MEEFVVHEEFARIVFENFLKVASYIFSPLANIGFLASEQKTWLRTNFEV